MSYNHDIMRDKILPSKSKKQKSAEPLTFGLDIGIASVGWAVLSPERIIDLGVRAFDKAETTDGKPLNLARRTARLARRRLRRRASRLLELAKLLKHESLIDNARLFKEQKTFHKSLWQLRVEGLNRRLDAEEWARVIYHLCKHRGFHWTSRAEEKAAESDSKGEGGKVKDGLAGTEKLMREKNYRTAAEMVLAEFPKAQRNKQGGYSKALSRTLLAKELALLFQHQRELGNVFASKAMEEKILGNGDKKTGLFWEQKPALAGKDLLKMLGKCTLDKTEYRAPKASFTAERHVWLTRLNNLRIIDKGIVRGLNEQERQIALPLPYQQAGDLSYKQLRAALVKSDCLSDSFLFIGLTSPGGKQEAEGKAKNPETAALVKLPAWQQLRAALKKAGMETEWQSMAAAAVEGKPQLLDQITCVLSIYKEDDEVAEQLRKLPLPDPERMINALLDIRFDKFHALSLKVLYQIVPHMESGLRYDEACVRAGYHHSQLQKVDKADKYLPPLYAGRDENGCMVPNDDLDIPRNPVVLRALNQARKLVNALIRKYGSPHAVHIEMARDLSRPLDERKKIQKAQEEFRNRNENDRARFAKEFDSVAALNGKNLEKWQFYREQQCKCAYSIEPLDINRLFEQGYVEIDHALPRSRSFDYSKNNKVLVLAKENQNKGNRTPYEYLGGAENSERWRRYVTFVESNKSYRIAKRNGLLRKNFGEKEAEEFRNRNLNDTRYICRFFKNYIEQYLQLATGSKEKRCVVLSGQLTSFLRARWGFSKSREESDRHHALDATIVAACSHGMVKRLSDYSRRKELAYVKEGFIDPATGEPTNPAMLQQLREHFPQPWSHFRDELLARLQINDPGLLREKMEQFGTYSPDAIDALRPLFVSRAISRRGGGEIHKAQIFSVKNNNSTKALERVPLRSLTLAKLERMVGKHDPRNKALYEVLKDRLNSFDNDPDKAFGSQQPKLLKPSKVGDKAPEIRSIRVEVTQNSGLMLRGGIADLGNMMWVDIFRHETQGYSAVPWYQAGVDKIRGASGNRAGYTFCFSLTKNDFVEINIDSEIVRGYFVLYESDGRMRLRAHDQPQLEKYFFRKSIASAKSIVKFHVDILGRVYPAAPEKRRDLA
ncbi:MAG: type II CRISPR RNA-guided endonuclease Cas9 [Nitrosospira multiformis]|nr:type II CRISPR RNA-guided endonuclease Cas9 [Nitrosospira multiformis]